MIGGKQRITAGMLEKGSWQSRVFQLQSSEYRRIGAGSEESADVELFSYKEMLAEWSRYVDLSLT